jgi:hypothetical protein
MRFRNDGADRKVRIGDFLSGVTWETVRSGELIDLPESVGRTYGFSEVRETTGEIASTKVETKQFETSKDEFIKSISKVRGIGKKTAKDIASVFPSEEALLIAIAEDEDLPFRDDVVVKLKKHFRG